MNELNCTTVQLSLCDLRVGTTAWTLNGGVDAQAQVKIMLGRKVRRLQFRMCRPQGIKRFGVREGQVNDSESYTMALHLHWKSTGRFLVRESYTPD